MLMTRCIQNLMKIQNKFIPKKVIVEVVKTIGGSDCGLNAIAIGTALANGLNPSQLQFIQEKMRDHLACCFSTGALKLFL